MSTACLKKYGAVFLAVMGCITGLYAQQTTGVVTDGYARPVKGVVVRVEGSNAVATTAADGSYHVAAGPGSRLQFVHPAYNVEERTTHAKDTLNVRLSALYLQSHYIQRTKELTPDSAAPRVEVLYGQSDADAVLGAISTVHSSQLNTTPATQYLYALPGRLPGLNVVQQSGFYTPLTSPLTSVDIFVGNIPKNQSGAGPTDNTEFAVSLRGHAGSAGQAPVAVIDGVQREWYSIDPDMIESVSIARDALSSVLLGQNSSRGALIVTTRKPEAGAPRLSFTAETGFQQSLYLPKPLPAYQYAYLLNEALLNDGKSPVYSAADFNAFRNGSDKFGHPDVNWYNTLLKSNPLLQRYNMNVSGGGTTARYVVSLNYMNQAGFFTTSGANSYNTNDNLRRYLINSKIEVDVDKNFSLGLQVFGRLQEGNQPGARSATILNNLLTTPNNAYPVLNADGSYGGNSIYQQNLLAQSQSSGYVADYLRDIMVNLDLKYNFNNWLPGLWLKAKGNVSVQTASILDRSKQVPVFAMHVAADGDTTYNRAGSTVNQVNNYVSTGWARYWFGQAMLGYDKNIGLHKINATLLFDQKKALLNYDLPSALTNYGGKASYSYNHTYFAEGAITYSGYDRYAPSHRFGLFYAGGLGWDIAREAGVHDALPWLNQFKLRATYGKTGNANVDNYGYYIWRNYYTSTAGTYGIGNTYPNGSGLAEQNGGAGTAGTLSNIVATWEKAHKLDIGLDVSLLHDHLQLNADYYHERYYDVMQQRGNTVALIGLSYPSENIGVDLYTGAELALTYQNNIHSFNYFITGNVSIQQSKVLYADEPAQKYPWNAHTGLPVTQRFGYIATGLYQSDKDLANTATFPGYTPHAGDVKYKDLNGDGVIDQFDVTAIGSRKPVTYYGLTIGCSYRGIAFSMLLQGRANQDGYINNNPIDQGFGAQGNGFTQGYEQALGRWTPETAAYAKYPRLTAGGNAYNFNPNFYSTTFFLHNGNYVRLKNISLAYNLPAAWMKRLKLAGIKLFAEAQNLFTWAAYKDVDPEVALPSYPMQKVINFGINIKL